VGVDGKGAESGHGKRAEMQSAKLAAHASAMMLLGADAPSWARRACAASSAARATSSKPATGFKVALTRCSVPRASPP